MAQDVECLRRARPAPGRELALLVLLYVGYSAARLTADADHGTATANARALLHAEALLHIEVERWANSLVTGIPWLALASSFWYSLLHYVVTPAVLLWVYRARPACYREVRNALALGSTVGIAGFVLLPMAPPRMLPGYVDTLATTSGHGWWGSNASAPRGLGGLTNELAAMPSLHVGWALWCTWVVFLCCRHRSVRVLALAYGGDDGGRGGNRQPLRPRRRRGSRRDRPRIRPHGWCVVGPEGRTDRSCRRTRRSSTTRSSISSTASSR